MPSRRNELPISQHVFRLHGLSIHSDTTSCDGSLAVHGMSKVEKCYHYIGIYWVVDGRTGRTHFSLDCRNANRSAISILMKISVSELASCLHGLTLGHCLGSQQLEKHEYHSHHASTKYWTLLRSSLSQIFQLALSACATTWHCSLVTAAFALSSVMTTMLATLMLVSSSAVWRPT